MKPIHQVLIAVGILLLLIVIFGGAYWIAVSQPTEAEAAAQASENKARAEMAADPHPFIVREPTFVPSARPIEEKKKIFAELCVAEKNATHPFLHRPNDYDARQAALEVAQKEVQRRYSITRKEYFAIMAEGTDCEWLGP